MTVLTENGQEYMVVPLLMLWRKRVALCISVPVASVLDSQEYAGPKVRPYSELRSTRPSEPCTNTIDATRNYVL